MNRAQIVEYYIKKFEGTLFIQRKSYKALVNDVRMRI